MKMLSRVQPRLVGQERGVHAAENDLDAPCAILGGDLVAAARGVGLDRDRGQIGRLVVWDRLHPVVVEDALDVGRRHAGEHGEHQRLHAALVDVEAVLHAPDVRLDERDPHGSASQQPVLLLEDLAARDHVGDRRHAEVER